MTRTQITQLTHTLQAPLGFVNPLLYKMAGAAPTAFNKITWGSNRCTEQACCKFGYDVPAGMVFSVTVKGQTGNSPWTES